MIEEIFTGSLNVDDFEFIDFEVSKRKKRGKFYFTTETEEAIIRYNNESNELVRNYIYNEYIKYPFEKLAENNLNVYNFPYLLDTFKNKKADIISHLILNLSKYEKDKGKAFSYFTKTIFNYLIMHNDNNYKKTKIETSINAQEENDNNDQNNKIGEIRDHHHDNDESTNDKKHFIELLIKYWDENIDKIFKKKRDKEIAFAVLQLIERYEGIENFNKKNIYILIREMTGYKTQHITRVINKMKSYYVDLLNSYYKNGMFN